MKIPVYLTFDMLSQINQNGSDENFIYWLYVHAHIEKKHTLFWADNNKNTDNFFYQLVDESLSKDDLLKDAIDDIVPVTLPCDIDIRTHLLNIDGSDREIKTNRSSGNFLTKETLPQFRQLNGVTLNTEGGEQLLQEDGLSFANFFNSSFAETKKQLENEEKEIPERLDILANQLFLSLWEGPRRFYEAGQTFSNEGNLMQCPHPEDPEGVNITNNHSLLGHLIYLGEGPETLLQLEKLKKISVQFLLETNIIKQFIFEENEQNPGLDILKDGLVNADQLSPPELRYDQTVKTRVYTVGQLLTAPPYSVASPENTLMYMLNNSRINQDGMARNPIRKIQVISNTNKLKSLEKIKRISFTPQIEIEASLVPYRRYPSTLSPEKLKDGKGYIYELKVTNNYEKEFWALMGKDPDDELLKNLPLFDLDGNLIPKSDIEYLGDFLFPWDNALRILESQSQEVDQERRTILYFCKTEIFSDERERIKDEHGDFHLKKKLGGDKNYIRLFFNIPTGNQNYEAELKSIPNEDGHLTWIVEHTKKPNFKPIVSPDCLKAVPIATNGETIKDLKVNDLEVKISFFNEPGFIFAQSLSSRELIADTVLAFEHGEKDNRDIFNFSGLNVRELTGESYIHLNPHDECMPYNDKDYEENMRDGEIEYSLIYNYHFSAKEDFSIKENTDMHKHYNDLFARAQTDRTLRLDIEHTFGHLYRFNETYSSSTHLDFPTAHPAGIGDKGEENKPPLHFVSADYEKEPQSLILNINTGFLNHPTTLVKAETWKTIAEIANAKEVTLEVIGLFFDFRESLKNGGGILDGMKPISDTSLTLQATELVDWCKGVMAGTIIPTQALDAPPMPQEYDLDQFNINFSKSCNVLKIRLKIIRKDEMSPKEDSDYWQIYKDGQGKNQGKGAIDVLPTDEYTEQLNDWILLLNERKAVLSAAEHKDSESFRNILMDKEAGGGWVIPEGVLDGRNASVSPVLVPCGFLPIQPSPHIDNGYEMGRLIRLYFDTLQNVIDLAYPDWANNNNFTTWQDFLKGLEKFQFEDLIEQCVNLFWTQPDSKDDSINEAVKQTSIEMMKINADFNSYIKEHLKTRLLANPSLFSNVKAFIYLQFASSPNELIPNDFHNYTLKLTPDDQSNQIVTTSDQEDGQVLSAPWWKISKKLMNEKWCGSLCALDDRIFDNEIHYQSLHLERFESIVEKLKVNGTEDVAPIKTEVVHLPGGSVTSHNSDQKTINLASRRNLSPVTPYAPFVSELMQKNDWKNHIADYIRLDEFAKGNLGKENEGDGKGEGLKLIARSDRADVSNLFIDQRIVSAIFVVRGDEESDTSNDEALINDTFHITINEKVNLEEPLETDFLIPKDAKDLLEALSKLTAAGQYIQRPERATQNDVREFIKNSLKSKQVEFGPIKHKPFITVQKSSTDSLKLEMHYHTNGPVIEAILFRDFKQEDRVSIAGEYYLVVNVLWDVWFDLNVGLTQGRNLHSYLPATITQKRFDEKFALLGSDTKAKTPYISHLEIDLLEEKSSEEIVLVSRIFSAQELITECLINHHRNMLPNGANAEWRKHPVSITVSHHQRMNLKAVYPDNGDIYSTEKLYSGSKPDISEEVDIKQTSEHKWFSDDYNEFLIDFMWRDQTAPIFTIKNIKVRIAEN